MFAFCRHERSSAWSSATWWERRKNDENAAASSRDSTALSEWCFAKGLQSAAEIWGLGRGVASFYYCRKCRLTLVCLVYGDPKMAAWGSNVSSGRNENEPVKLLKNGVKLVTGVRRVSRTRVLTIEWDNGRSQVLRNPYWVRAMSNHHALHALILHAWLCL